MLVKSLRNVTAGCVLGALFAGAVWSQNEAPAKKAPAAAQPKAAAVDPQAAEKLAGYMAQRKALGEKLQKLQGEFSKAEEAKDEAKLKSIRTQFDELIGEFNAQLLPKMVAVALPLYQADGKNADAQEIALGYLNDLFVQNRYADVVKEGEKLFAAGRKHPAILNFLGVSLFAMHDFAKAEIVLKDAEAVANGGKDQEAASLFGQLGSRYLEECTKYADLWAKEREIRQKESAATGDQKLPRVVFKTTKGDIELELFENEAPNTVANFVSLVDAKKYNGIAFHRVIPNFMAQGGDPNTLDQDPRNDGAGGPGYHIACECYRPDARMHFTGSLSMAHAGPDSGGSQFFLTHLPTSHLNPHDGDNPARRGGHTVFGRIVKGLDVAAAITPGDRIVSATVTSKRNHPYVPKKLPADG